MNSNNDIGDKIIRFLSGKMQQEEKEAFTKIFGEREDVRRQYDEFLLIKEGLEVNGEISENHIDYGSYEKLSNGIEGVLLDISDFAEIQDLSIKGDLVIIESRIPTGIVVTDDDTELLEELATDLLGENTKIQLRVERFEVN